MIVTGDAIEEIRKLPDQSVDLVFTDPPYGETSLCWDNKVGSWQYECLRVLKPSGSMWVFGSLRSHLEDRDLYRGWRVAQDVIWEKHNGSGASADRFRRVHEILVQYYPCAAKWRDVYKSPVYSLDAAARSVRRKQKPQQWGDMGPSSYATEDGGKRLLRSVLCVRSCHGSAVHPTQKPLDLLKPIIQYSCPVGGVVLDPFGGSGSISLAALQLERKTVYVERNAGYVEIAKQRLQDFLDLP